MISLNRTEIEELIDLPGMASAIEDAYRATSRGDVNLPPVGHIMFADGADCHIKYGHVLGDPTFVIKVATGFPKNPDLGLPTGNGMVLVLSAVSGQVEAILHDEMVLTDVRTGLGGAIASRLLARPESKDLLVIGTGPQARWQIKAHAALLPNLRFRLWGRDPNKAKALIEEMAPIVEVSRETDLAAAASNADIIVTATGSKSPLLQSKWIRAGTHITAVGADAPGKQELDTALVARADVLAVDLRAQCVDHGEVSHAVKAGLIARDDLVEIGTLLAQTTAARSSQKQLTIADLTGIAAQDIVMANAVLAARRLSPS